MYDHALFQQNLIVVVQIDDYTFVCIVRELRQARVSRGPAHNALIDDINVTRRLLNLRDDIGGFF